MESRSGGCRGTTHGNNICRTIFHASLFTTYRGLAGTGGIGTYLVAREKKSSTLTQVTKKQMTFWDASHQCECTFNNRSDTTTATPPWISRFEWQSYNVNKIL